MKDITMNNGDLTKYFNENIKALKELSKDTANEEYLTESMCLAVDFDMVKTCYANNLDLTEECMKSVDAIIMNDENPILIEFKNGKVCNSNIKTKMKDSLLLVCDILNTKISETRHNMEFIVVYNQNKMPLKDKNIIQESKSRDCIGRYFINKAGREYIRFGLEEYVDLLFRKIHTYDEIEFKEYLIRHKLYII